MNKHSAILGTTLLLCLVNVLLGQLASAPVLTAAGALGVCYVLLRVVQLRRTRREAAAAAVASARTVRARPAAARTPVDPGDSNALIEQMLQQRRYCLLLRPQLAGNLSEPQFRRTIQALNSAMALVPDGEVVLGKIDEALEDGKLDDEDIAAARGRVIRVERFFLDRHPVTNEEFYEFVAAGGYEQMSLWDKSILPAVLDLVDRTGMPGPRYWEDGCFALGEERHPVVGVSWYEACAYARWTGKRLPSDAEWVKAGSWPVPLSSDTRIQRKYPWGDTMERRRANLWGSGPNRTVPVDHFADGVSVGGIYQLVGNVWEWNGGNFRPSDHPLGDLVLPTPMKSVRGGAFDTYFDNQATCQFQSGENPLHRRHNVGFRCAVGLCDLMLARAASTRAEKTGHGPPAEPSVPEPQEVHA